MLNDFLNYCSANRQRHLEELKALLRIPSISALPEHKSDMERAASFVEEDLRQMVAPPGCGWGARAGSTARRRARRRGRAAQGAWRRRRRGCRGRGAPILPAVRARLRIQRMRFMVARMITPESGGSARQCKRFASSAPFPRPEPVDPDPDRDRDGGEAGSSRRASL